MKAFLQANGNVYVKEIFFNENIVWSIHREYSFMHLKSFVLERILFQKWKNLYSIEYLCEYSQIPVASLLWGTIVHYVETKLTYLRLITRFIIDTAISHIALNFSPSNMIVCVKK